MLEYVLSASNRRRVTVVPIGSDSRLLDAARVHALSSPTVPILVYWDGDVTEAKIRSWFNSSELGKDGCAEKVEWSRSPRVFEDGNWLPPEGVVKARLLTSEVALKAIADRVGVSEEVFRSTLSTCIVTTNHHALFRELSEALSISERRIQEIVLMEYVSLESWSALNSQIARMLNGNVSPFEQPEAN